MEAAAGRSGSLPVPSPQPLRKEWRAIPEHSFRSNGSEEQDHVKLGQTDERTIYEEGTMRQDMDFCSITIDGSSLNEEISSQQRIHDICLQRMKLQEMEIELRAQAVARSEILEIQSSYNAQIKEHANAAAKLQDQLQEKEQHASELNKKLEEKERELRAMKVDNEVAWAKDDQLREQNKELASFRRERDNSEAERSQHLKQIHDLQEHIQEKDTQFVELGEQHRVAQETILYKDEQLREAQAWIARVQEMDALQLTTNQSLQTELRERTEQFNQYWSCLLRQYAEMERYHLQVIQQLQLELAGAGERNLSNINDSQLARASSESLSINVQSKENQFHRNENGFVNDSRFISNGSSESVPYLVSSPSPKVEHIPGVPLVSSSILGVDALLPPGQVTALPPFIMHPQIAPHSVASTRMHIPPSQLGHFQPTPAMPSYQDLQSQKAVPENSPMPDQNQCQPSEKHHNALKSDAYYSYEIACSTQVTPSNFSESSSSCKPTPEPVITGSTEEEQVLESNGELYSVPQKSPETLNENYQYHSSLEPKLPEQNSQQKVCDEISAAATNDLQGQVLKSEQAQSTVDLAYSAVSSHSESPNDASECNVNASIMPEVSGSAAKTSNSTLGRPLGPALLDERSLLACIVRAIPAGSNGGIRISSTLPNRLGKMLAPHHWHDYKKQYGKLDDFVSHHPELFVIEGDFIHLREGAQKIVSANAAAAKFAAAVATSAPYLSQSVVVTPVAQSHQLKRCQSADDMPSDKHLQLLTTIENQQSDGGGTDIVQSLKNVKILGQSKEQVELNDISSESRPGQSTGHFMPLRGRNADKAGVLSSQNKGLNNRRRTSGARQQGRK